MSKRAEERALEKYPVRIAKCIIFPEARGGDFNAAKRKAYQEGYEQAEKDINREMLDRMTEIREKQTKAALEDLDYTIKIDPALGFDEGSAVVYHGKEIISVLTWEDIKTIEQIIATSDWYDFEINGKLWSKEFYEEVLKRFKETKK